MAVALTLISVICRQIQADAGTGFGESQMDGAASTRNSHDSIRWKLTGDGQFTFSSAYNLFFMAKTKYGINAWVFEQRSRPTEQLFGDIKEEITIWKSASIFHPAVIIY
uniref:Legume lectin domain-containing protein n=1 Tax=Oryza meridionalis TaxID=40149 RepID=A0A0E0FD68_9ORYZ